MEGSGEADTNSLGQSSALDSVDAFLEIYTELLSDIIIGRGPEPPEGVLRLCGETTTMQTLDIDRPGMPDLQFVLLVTALCTSRLTSLNVPEVLRTTIFNRCWMLIHESPPPGRLEERVLDLRPWTEVTVEAMVEIIRAVLTESGIQTLAWEHPPSEPNTHQPTRYPSPSTTSAPRNGTNGHRRIHDSLNLPDTSDLPDSSD